MPVVITGTVQVDAECGFEAKASLNAAVRFTHDSRLRFCVEYNCKDKSVKGEAPKYEKNTTRELQVTGDGSITVACGLIPRINVFAYDAIGIFAGLRGSLVARAAYEERCTGDATSSRPDGEAKVSLAANIGLQVGARVQAPGSSFAGTAGQKAGTDIGPFEPWQTEFNLYSRTWPFPKRGFGYCTPTCKNGGRVARETGVDCGGGQCGPCPAGQSCGRNTDCSPGLFCSGGTCSTGSCGDGVLSGRESDVDCGGQCSGKCALGQQAFSGADCQSGVAIREPGGLQGVCALDSCKNGVRDGDECAVDCGGSRCAPCAAGTLCGSDRDCGSGHTNGTACVTDRCRNNRKDGDETDRDCGGSCAQKCGGGQACATHADCGSGAPVCSGGVCGAPSCTDGQKNGRESDVDCGGRCAPYGEGRACAFGTDCASAVCSAGVCAAPRCNDGRRNGNETGVDCGGPCAPCPPEAAPPPPPAPNARTCGNGVKDGDETDVDCGGTVCAACAVGKACAAPRDCGSALCEGGQGRASLCNDGIKNGAETDIDCGGGTCAACVPTRGCSTGSDCQSLVCDVETKKCRWPSCGDGVKNGGESDVDCGAACSGEFHCSGGKTCFDFFDCLSESCTAGVCDPFQ